jgi:hypothetical protein
VLFLGLHEFVDKQPVTPSWIAPCGRCWQAATHKEVARRSCLCRIAEKPAPWACEASAVLPSLQFEACAPQSALHGHHVRFRLDG